MYRAIAMLCCKSNSDINLGTLVQFPDKISDPNALIFVCLALDRADAPLDCVLLQTARADAICIMLVFLSIK